ncbi:MAG: sensor histidine kinase [Elusimicrobiaceae bacterium]|nr:sensor histidine kinase [Elusimicrobiaceae bacterium]
MSIFSKLFKLFITVVLMPLIPMALLLAYYQSRQKDNILETHYNLAEVVSSDINHYAEDLNWRLSFAQDIQALLEEKKDPLPAMKQALEKYPDINVLAVTDGTGKELARQSREGLFPTDNHLSEQILSEMAQAPRVYIAPLETLQGTLEFEFIVPLKNGYFLYGITELSDLADRLQQMRIGQTGQVFLVSTQGVLYNGPSQWAPQIEAEKLKKHFEGKSRLFKNLHGRGDTFVGAFSPAKPLGVNVVVLQVKEEAYRSLHFANLILMLFVLAIAVLAYYGARTFARSLGEPIAELAQGAREISQGNFDYHVKEEIGWGELQELMISFNKMTADLKDYQALQLKNQVSEMKEHIFRSVAHDLRAPLLGLQGYIYILSSGKINEEQRREYLSRMEEAAKDLSALLEDVLAVSRVEAGMTLPQRQRLQARPLVASLVNTQEPVAAEKGLKLSYDVADTLSVYADPKLLRRIINNLLSNAVKFTAKGQVFIKAYENEKNTFIEVKDSGIGLTEKQCKEIFEKYRQVDDAAEGYGLGLFISRQLARAHGGELSVSSEPERGSTFTLSLPKEDA